MFRYIFALLLLNSSYHSLGLPLPPGVTNVSLANLLTTLANNCENKFLSSQIKSKLEYCSDLTSPGRKKLDCLIFYDINKQLCSAVGASELALNEDYSAKINDLQDVNLLCETSEQWVFTNLTEFPQYKSTVEKMFKHPVNCGRVCSVEDVVSDDSNFYCKYFKWGTDMLKAQVSLPTLPQENTVKLPSETSNENKQASNDLVDVKIKNSSTNTPSTPSEVASSQNEVIKTNEEKKPGVSAENNLEIKTPSIDTAAANQPEVKNVQEPMPEENQVPIDQADKPAEITNPEDNNEGPKNSPDTTLTKPESDAQKAEIQQLNNELEHKEPVIETPGQSKEKPGDSVDYQDGEEGKEGLGDIQGDDDGDDDDAMIGDVNKVKLEDQKEEPSETQNLKNVVSGITGESSLYPSFGQDEYSSDDDDHFFSFFLTAVIMVVLIYILYHNKNKVGKVFFGLILEGRQSGRRRNSRGHAYRRLDTLEQAMSTNSAAPPSKIIY